MMRTLERCIEYGAKYLETQRPTYPEDSPTTFCMFDPDYCIIPPLVRAVHAGHGRLVRLLVENGANVNAYYEGFEKSKSSRRRGSLMSVSSCLSVTHTKRKPKESKPFQSLKILV